MEATLDKADCSPLSVRNMDVLEAPTLQSLLAPHSSTAQRTAENAGPRARSCLERSLQKSQTPRSPRVRQVAEAPAEAKTGGMAVSRQIGSVAKNRSVDRSSSLCFRLPILTFQEFVGWLLPETW